MLVEKRQDVQMIHLVATGRVPRVVDDGMTCSDIVEVSIDPMIDLSGTARKEGIKQRVMRWD